MFCQYLLYFLLFGLTFLIIPTTISPYEIPKAFGAPIIIVVLILLNILSPKFWHILGMNKLQIIFSVLLIGLLIYQPEFLWGNPFRPQGVVLYASLFLLFLISPLATAGPFNLPTFSKLATISLIFLFIYTLIIGPRESFRFIGPLGEANSLAAAVLFLFPLALSYSNKKYQKISFVLAILLIIMSGSRAGFLGFFAEILILFFRQRKTLFKAGILLFSIIFLGALILPLIPHAIPEQVNMRFENRTDIWVTSYLAGFDHPLLGSGFGSMEKAINQKAWETTNFIRFQSVDSGHNLFLNWWIMGGGLGLILFITLMLISVINLYKTKSWQLLSILIGLLIIQLFNPVSSVILVQFWYILGMGFSKIKY